MKETTAADQAKQNLSFKKIPDVHETEISMDKKVDLMSSEMEEEEQVLEKIYKHPGESRAEVDIFDAKNDDSDSKWYWYLFSDQDSLQVLRIKS